MIEIRLFTTCKTIKGHCTTFPGMYVLWYKYLLYEDENGYYEEEFVDYIQQQNEYNFVNTTINFDVISKSHDDIVKDLE